MRLAQRRQDPGEQHIGAAALRRGARRRHQRVELRVQIAQARAVEPARRRVGLEVEPRELGREPIVVRGCQHFERDRRGLAVGADQEHLLLGADATAALERSGVEHLLERVDVIEQRLHEGAGPFVLAHSPPTSMRQSRRAPNRGGRDSAHEMSHPALHFSPDLSGG